MTTKNYFKYWGKASKDKNTPVDYHLLVYHCLDVAAVADCLLASEQLNFLAILAKQLKVKPTWLRKWLVFCIALHDVGKFFRSFQNQNCNDVAKLVTEIPKFKYTIIHDALGVLLFSSKDFREQLADIFSCRKLRRKVCNWLKITCGHHGKPIASNSETAINDHMLVGEDDLAAKNFIIDAYNLFFNDEDANIVDQIDKKD